MKKTAIPNQAVVAAINDRKLRRQTSLVPREEFLQYGLRLLARVWAERKAHEIAVGHQFGEPSDVFGLERTQN
jgi:hypothetical protein